MLELGRPEMGLLLITHYTRILKYIAPQFVHVLVDGRIARSGGPELADLLEEKGYEWLRQEMGGAAGAAAHGAARSREARAAEPSSEVRS